MNLSTFICYGCKREFPKEITEGEMKANYFTLYNHLPNESDQENVALCDSCYNRTMRILDIMGHTPAKPAFDA